MACILRGNSNDGKPATIRHSKQPSINLRFLPFSYCKQHDPLRLRIEKGAELLLILSLMSRPLRQTFCREERMLVQWELEGQIQLKRVRGMFISSARTVGQVSSSAATPYLHQHEVGNHWQV